MTETLSLRINKRALRSQAHFFFDNIWKHKFMTRDESYLWLANKLDIFVRDCHFKDMNRTLMMKAIDVSVEYLNERYQLTDLPKYIIIKS